MNKFFIVTNQDKDPNQETTNYICNYLKERKCQVEVLIRGQSDALIRSAQDVKQSEIDVPADTQCILVLGGDGTLLRCARDTASKNVPLLGINLGNLGFLAEVDQSGIDDCLEHLISDQYEIEERMMLDGVVIRDGKQVWNTHALNDIVVNRTGKLMVLPLEIHVNGMLLNRYLADGMIISTPTGSTGYSLSAGGPIVEPRAKLMVMTPICPHTLNTRSIVLSDEDHVEIRIGLGRDGLMQQAEVNFDGGMTFSLKSGDCVSMGKSKRVVKLIHINKVSFLETLRKKMSES